MATYGITHTLSYDYGNPAGANGTVQLPAQNIVNTISDMDADTIFTIGDSVQLFGITYNYAGKVMIDGLEWPIFDYVDGNPFQFRLVMMTQAPVSPPGTLTPSDINAGGFTVCFAKGTMIATPNGEVAVETLSGDDLVLTQDGRAVPVLWVGTQTQNTFFGGSHMQPVRIRAGALGGGLPHSDLTVTADHGMVFPSSSEAVGETKHDNLVINASALVNGDTIDFVPMAELEDRFTVYHIETEAHDVILANGAASETFVDAATRANFDNHQEYLDLYGADRIIPEMDRPRITSPRTLPKSLREKLHITTPNTAGYSSQHRAAS